MWIRIRLDIGWRDLGAALGYCCLTSTSPITALRTRQAWCPDQDCLVTLSVRSAWDLALRALELPKGSEVVMTAWTVPGMIQILHAHGLVPVPIDVDQQGRPYPQCLDRALSDRSRILLIAHLFGNTIDMEPIIRIAKRHQLLVAEDRAQSFCQVGERGHPESDLVMHSFGPIKTATALGGGVIRVRCATLRDRMTQLHTNDPRQSRWHFFRRVLKFSILKTLSGRRISAVIHHGFQRMGWSFDQWVNAQGTGFAADRLLEQIRKQPSDPQLRLLRRRWEGWDASIIDHRKQLGQQMDHLLGSQGSGGHYWLYPVFDADPEQLALRLRNNGFDATTRSRMTVVPNCDSRQAERAHANWQRIVFLPWQVDLPEDAMKSMAHMIQQHRHRSADPMPDDLLPDLPRILGPSLSETGIRRATVGRHGQSS